MICLKCSKESKVIDSRIENGLIKRRRECLECKHRWNTYELHSDLCSSLVKKQNKKYKTCSKCNRIVYAWKFCIEHLNEYKRLDMQERRAYYKKTGKKKPKMKKGHRT